MRQNQLDGDLTPTNCRNLGDGADLNSIRFTARSHTQKQTIISSRVLNSSSFGLRYITRNVYIRRRLLIVFHYLCISFSAVTDMKKICVLSYAFISSSILSINLYIVITKVTSPSLPTTNTISNFDRDNHSIILEIFSCCPLLQIFASNRAVKR